MQAWRLGPAVALLIAAGGCGFEPFEPPSSSELRPGPGLFTGKRGEWVILRPAEPETTAAEPGPQTDAVPQPADARPQRLLPPPERERPRPAPPPSTPGRSSAGS
jgi:hypothetical protein